MEGLYQREEMGQKIHLKKLDDACLGFCLFVVCVGCWSDLLLRRFASQTVRPACCQLCFGMRGGMVSHDQQAEMVERIGLVDSGRLPADAVSAAFKPTAMGG